NIRNALDSDGLQKKIEELTQNISELQIQTHLYESRVRNKDTALLQTLRVEKNKLLNNVQQMQQELISFLEATNSLHCELELAQQASEIPGIEWTALDESLDKEVLLLLEGPERVGEKFKATILKLQEDLAGLPLLNPTDWELDLQETYQKTLMKESLDKELIKMAGNMRRMRTEQLHLKKMLLSRQHEIQSTKQLKEDALAETDVLRLKLEELTEQLEEAGKR
ncbi:hypothetical protein E2320_004339, partial [Naja naja]